MAHDTCPRAGVPGALILMTFLACRPEPPPSRVEGPAGGGPPDLVRAFEPNARHGADAPMTVRVVSIGELAVPTGRLIVTDPYANPDPVPLSLTVPPGRYPVLLSLARRESDEFENVAAAMVRFADAVPVSWRPALWPGQDEGSLGENQFFGYPVDSGNGAFMDSAGSAAFERLRDPEMRYIARIGAEQERHLADGGWANVIVDSATALNVVLFPSGFGDGTYPSYWGHDSAGRVVRLVTDFGVLPPADTAR